MNAEVAAARPHIEKLESSHVVDAFDCGSLQLDTYLKRFALVNQNAGGARTYVAATDRRVVGFYSLSSAQVEYGEAPDRMRKGLAKHPIPVILIARLAVDRSWQGQGLGAALLVDSLRRIHAASDIIGVRAVMVHAKDEAARRFYEHFDFDPSPIDPLHMFLLTKEIARLFRA